MANDAGWWGWSEVTNVFFEGFDFKGKGCLDRDKKLTPVLPMNRDRLSLCTSSARFMRAPSPQGEGKRYFCLFERGDLSRNNMTIVKFRMPVGLQSSIFKLTNSQIFKFPSSLAERSRSHIYFSKWLPELISIWRNYIPAWRKERGDSCRNDMTIVRFQRIRGLMRLIFKGLEY